jgi:hypothetical protein
VSTHVINQQTGGCHRARIPSPQLNRGDGKAYKALLSYDTDPDLGTVMAKSRRAKTRTKRRYSLNALAVTEPAPTWIDETLRRCLCPDARRGSWKMGEGDLFAGAHEQGIGIIGIGPRCPHAPCAFPGLTETTKSMSGSSRSWPDTMLLKSDARTQPSPSCI